MEYKKTVLSKPLPQQQQQQQTTQITGYSTKSEVQIIGEYVSEHYNNLMKSPWCVEHNIQMTDMVLKSADEIAAIMAKRDREKIIKNNMIQKIYNKTYKKIKF